jgi:hypothetical protein
VEASALLCGWGVYALSIPCRDLQHTVGKLLLKFTESNVTSEVM